MAMTANGLTNAVPDTCTNYKPIKGEYTGVASCKLGPINKCKNWKQDPKIKGIGKQDNACCWCKNRKETD